MRFMVIVKATAESEAGAIPAAEMLEKMGAFNEEMIAAGVMLAGEGLRDSSLGARMTFDGKGEPTVIDGPFAETKELVAGFWLISVKSKDDVIAWMRRAPFVSSDIEIRQVFEVEDFGSEMSPELLEKEADFRKRSGHSG